jgi:hypothetical protein
MIVDDGKQKMLGTAGEIEAQGFDVNEIMQSYTQTLKKKEKSKEEDEEKQKKLLMEKAGFDESEMARKLAFLKKITDEHVAIQEQAKADRALELSKSPSKDQPEEKTKVADLIDKEADIPKSVGFSDYRNLLSFGAGWFGMLIWVFVVVTTSLLQLSTSFTLANWTT